MIKAIIHLTHRNRQRIAEMCVALLPRVGYARITHSGMAILKKSRWSLFSKRIPVTDIIMKFIPIEVGKLICKKSDRAVYVSLFNDRVATIVSLTKYCDKLDLLDVVYKEYMKACGVPECDIEILKYEEPIPLPTQSYNIQSMFKKMKLNNNPQKLSSRIEKLKANMTPFRRIISIINI